MTTGDENGAPQAEWDEAVSRTVDRAEASKAEAEAAAQRQRPRSRKPLVAGLIMALALVVAWDVSRWNQPPAPLPPEEQTTSLRWVIAGVVEEVQAFRTAEGNLPSAADLEGLLDEAISYQVVGDGFRVVGTAGEIELTFDGSVPLEEWVANAGGGS